MRDHLSELYYQNLVKEEGPLFLFRDGHVILTSPNHIEVDTKLSDSDRHEPQRVAISPSILLD